MKTLTIRQPWVWWIGNGWKTIETRTHKAFRNLAGERVAIHAGKFFDLKAFKIAMPYLSESQMQETIMSFNDAVKKPVRQEFDDPRFGAVQFTAIFSAFRRLTIDDSQASLCYSDGLYGLFVEDIKHLRNPVKWRGQQRIYDIPDELIESQYE